MIDIRDISGRIKLSVSIGSGSLHRFELMKEDYISIVFSLEIPVQLEIGDNVDYEGSFYYVTDKVYPSFNTSNGGYDYTLRLESHYYRWKNHILFYDRQGNKEASWSLTRSPEAHLSIVVSNLRAIGFTFNGKEYQAIVDSSVDPIAKLVQYDNTNIIDALTKIAEAWECEWWVDGDKIYLGHLEHGEPVNLEIGKEISSMSRSQSQDIFATRLYAFGSTRNIPSDYRKGETGAVVEGVIQKRLMLPAGTPYVDVIEGLEEEQVVEAVVIFDDIYPRVTGTITEVIPKEITDEGDSGDPITFTVYRFKDANLIFKEEYKLPGQDLHVIFQTGPLSGMDFALEFNPERLPEDNPEAQVFEIVRNDTYGQTLPESPLIPGTGNKYILYNFDTRYVNDALIPQAEQELLERTIAYKDKVVSDPSTYTCSLNSYRASGYDENNGLLNPEKEINLLPGQRVNLINKAYFENGRISRVIGFEKKLDIPYDSPVYTIGESAAYSRLGELEQKLDNIQFKGNTYVNQGGGFGVYIVKKDDTTAASDENVFSALRTLYEINKAYVDISDMYLRKDIDDTAYGNILFDKKIGSSIFIDGWEGKGWEIQSTGAALLDSLRVRSDIYVGGNTGSPTFASGFTGWGWQIDTPTATGEMDNLFIRKTFTAYEIVYSQIYGLGGSQIVSDINKIARVEVMADRYRCYMDDMDGLMLMNLRKGDGVRIQTRTDTTSIKYLFGRCIGVDSDYFDIAIPLIEGTGQPEAGDFALRWGNNEDTDRQGLIYLTTADSGAPFIDVYDGITDASTEGKLKARIGHLTGIRTQRGDQLSGYGAYLNGIYVENSTFILQNGDTIEQTFSAMNGKFESLIDSIRNDISAEGGNILVNSSFSQNTNYWTAANNVHFINVGGEYLWLDGSFYVEKDQVADIYNDNGQNVLRIRNTYILQQNAIMNIPDHTEEEEKTYSFSLFYKVLRTGSCGFGIPGTELYHEEQLPESDSYQKLSKVGKWDGKGDFELRFTGEILIYGVGLFSDEIADAIVKLQTQIDQTDEYIKLLATKDYVDSETEEIYVHYDSQLQITAEQMSGISTKVDNINNTIESAGWITQADGVALFAKKSDLKTLETSVANLSVEYDQISSAVGTNTQGIKDAADLANKAFECGLYSQEQYSQTNDPWQSWPSGQEFKHVGALWYNPSTKITKRYVGVNGTQSWETVNDNAVSAASFVLQNKDKWRVVVANFDADGNPTEESGIMTTAYGNNLYARKDNIISSINQSPESITLEASKINLKGATRIGSFTISESGWFKCDANLDGSIGYITMKGTNTEVSFGQDLIPSTSGGAFTLTSVIKNRKNNYLNSNFFNWDPEGNKNVGLNINTGNCDFPIAIDSEGFNSFKGGLSVVTYIPSSGYKWNDLKYKDIFVFQGSTSVTSVITLPTKQELFDAFGGSDYFSNGLALSYQAVIKFTFLITRYSGKVAFRGVSGIPIIGTAGSIYGSGNYTYGQYEATPGTIVTFYYYNNNYYINSNAF
ncbi:hypothetical protein NXV05_08475 [Parabacteroides johnsonii]|nr:hypothetical protein [Parabacteroides johnsonii]